MTFLYGNIYEGAGRRKEGAGVDDTDSEDEARELTLGAPESDVKSTITAVTVTPTAGVSRGQLVVKSSSIRNRGGGAASGPGAGIGVVQNIRPRPRTTTTTTHATGGIMGPPRKAKPHLSRPQSGADQDGAGSGGGGAHLKLKPPLAAAADDDEEKVVKHVPSVRKQRPAPPPQRGKTKNDENAVLGAGNGDDADVLCRVVPSQSNDATYRLGGKHVNKSNAAAHASGRCCCAHERRYMLGSVEKVRQELLVVQTSMAKGIWWVEGEGGGRKKKKINVHVDRISDLY